MMYYISSMEEQHSSPHSSPHSSRTPSPVHLKLSEPVKCLFLLIIISVILTQYFYFTMPLAYLTNEFLVKRELSTTVTGFLYGAFSASLALAALLTSKISRLMSPRTSLIVSLVVLTCSTPLLIPFSYGTPSIYFIVIMLLVRIAQGFVMGASEPQLMSQMTLLYPDKLGLIASSFEIGAALSSMVGPIMGGFFYEKYGFDVAFNFPTAINLVTSLLGIVVLTVIKRLPQPEPQPQPASYDTLNETSIRENIATYRKMALLPIFILGVNVESLIAMLVNTVEAFFPNYIWEDYGKSEITSGLVMTVAGIIYTAATVFSGWSGDRFNNRRTLILLGLLMAGIACMGSDVSVYGIPQQSYVLPSAMLCLLNIGSGLIQVSVLPLIILHYHQSTGLPIDISTCDMSGLFRAMYFIGAFCGPVFGGYILHFSTYPVLFLTMGVLLLLHVLYIGLVNLCKPDLFDPGMVSQKGERTPILSKMKLLNTDIKNL